MSVEGCSWLDERAATVTHVGQRLGLSITLLRITVYLTVGSLPAMMDRLGLSITLLRITVYLTVGSLPAMMDRSCLIITLLRVTMDLSVRSFPAMVDGRGLSISLQRGISIALCMRLAVNAIKQKCGGS